jgi:macrolide-specific efflux system membrane fusion protein
MSRSWPFLVVLAAGGIGATSFYVTRRGGKASSESGTRVVHAERRLIANTVNATGTIRLRGGSEVRVGSQLSGIVKTLNVTVGSRVKAGDVIAEIDDRLIEARLADAEAQIELDRASMERAHVNSERAQKLVSQSLIPVQQAEDLRLAFEEAKAKYHKSLRDRELVEVDLRYVEIRAPISGTVAAVSTQRGETVAASFAAPTFVTIIGEHALEMVAMVDETDIANVRRGNLATFTVDAYPSRDFLGVVETVAPKATIVSGVVNYEVTIAIRKDEDVLKPDMTANVSVRTGQHEGLMLPSSAIQRDGERAFVYLAGKTPPNRQMVVTGNKQNDVVEIKKGISETDNVLLLRDTKDPSVEPTS